MIETRTLATAPMKTGQAPLVGPAGAVLAILLGGAGWPMLATGSELVFSDTESYIRGGRIVGAMAMDLAGDLLPRGPRPQVGRGAAR